MPEAVPPPELVKEFVIAAHGDLKKVQAMLASNPNLLNAGYRWSPTDVERPIQAAAQTGAKQIIEFLLSSGAPVDVCAVAALGRTEQLDRILSEDPTLARARGAHGIPLLPHAVQSGDLETVKLVLSYGAIDGASTALHFAVAKGNLEMVTFLLDRAVPDLSSKNYQGKTPLAVAREKGFKLIELALISRGAKD